MSACSRSARARSGSAISAILASTSRSPAALSFWARASAFSSLARSFIAARSSAVKPADVLSLALLRLVDCWAIPYFPLRAPLRDVLATTRRRASRHPRQPSDEPKREHVTGGRRMAGEAPSASLRCNTVTVAHMWKVLPGSCNARAAPCTEARGGPMEPASGERHRAINPDRPAASTRVAQHIHISRAGADDRPVAGWPWYRALAKVTEFHANWSGSRPRPPR